MQGRRSMALIAMVVKLYIWHGISWSKADNSNKSFCLRVWIRINKGHTNLWFYYVFSCTFPCDADCITCLCVGVQEPTLTMLRVTSLETSGSGWEGVRGTPGTCSHLHLRWWFHNRRSLDMDCLKELHTAIHLYSCRHLQQH